MDKALEMNKKLMHEAIRCLEKGYNKEDFYVLSQTLDNIKDISTIKAMNYEDTSIASKLCSHLEAYKETKKNVELDKAMKIMMQLMSMIHDLALTEEEKSIAKEHLKAMLNMFV